MNPTNGMTVRETFDYLAKQQTKGWPGSWSIHPFKRWKKTAAPVEEDQSQAT